MQKRGKGRSSRSYAGRQQYKLDHQGHNRPGICTGLGTIGDDDGLQKHTDHQAVAKVCQDTAKTQQQDDEDGGGHALENGGKHYPQESGNTGGLVGKYAA